MKYLSLILRMVFLLNRNPTTQTALTVCETTVAIAAPRTPIEKP